MPYTPTPSALEELTRSVLTRGRSQALAAAELCELTPDGPLICSRALAQALASGNDDNARALIPFSDLQAAAERSFFGWGQDALMAAASCGCQGAVLDLLDKCDPLRSNDHGETALMLASGLFNPRAALALIPLSDPARRARDGSDALSNAVLADSEIVALALLDAMKPGAATIRANQAREQAKKAGFGSMERSIDAWIERQELSACSRAGAPSRPLAL
jgi:hypothetical protein